MCGWWWVILLALVAIHVRCGVSYRAEEVGPYI